MAMCQARRGVVLAAALAAAAFNAKAQDGDISAGHAFAREACKVCHMVEAEEGSSRMIVIGHVANTPALTVTAMRVFLTSSHPKMPNLMLTPEEIADVSAQPPRSALSRAIVAFQSHPDHRFDRSSPARSQPSNHVI
jgi:mono/diheme cytochrome c family protein